MHVSNGFPHMLTSNQRGRGQEPVTVVGNIRSAVAVNIGTPRQLRTAQGWLHPQAAKKRVLS